MYVRESLFSSSLTSINHHFLPSSGNSYMLQPGGIGYEVNYAVTGVLPYFLSLSPNEHRLDTDDALREAFLRITKHEMELTERLLGYLKTKRGRGVRIVGDEDVSPLRVPTISFVITGNRALSSKQVVQHFDKKGNVGIISSPSYLSLRCLL
jgi:selenocysteine lyase/cysteine desulfurase